MHYYYIILTFGNKTKTRNNSVADLINDHIFVLIMNRLILASSMLAMFVLIVGFLQAEAYNEGVTITELRLYNVDIGKDGFTIGGITGPYDTAPTEQVKITIFDKNEDELIFDGYATVDDSHYFLFDDDDKKKFWEFSLDSETLERWSASGEYGMMVQLDGKSDEETHTFYDFKGELVLSDGAIQDKYQVVQTKIISDRPKDNDGTGYVETGSVITMNERVSNPHNYEVSASIEYVFENLEGNNHWENKKHTGTVSANGAYGTHQKYFMQTPGKFYIHMVYEIDGKVTKDPNPREFIVVEEYSDAATNGCNPDREIIVRSNYSQAVCVFPESIEKLVQRGWVSD